jgi:hypothetical protein
MSEYTRFGFEEGLNHLVDNISESSERPFVASIHGIPNQGKSHLMRGALKSLESKEKQGIGTKVGSSIDSYLTGHFQRISDLDFVLIEDMPHTTEVMRYSLETFGKRPDKLIYIRRSLFDLPEWLEKDLENGEYDFIIENPSSVDKGDPRV